MRIYAHKPCIIIHVHTVANTAKAKAMDTGTATIRGSEAPVHCSEKPQPEYLVSGDNDSCLIIASCVQKSNVRSHGEEQAPEGIQHPDINHPLPETGPVHQQEQETRNGSSYVIGLSEVLDIYTTIKFTSLTFNNCTLSPS